MHRSDWRIVDYHPVFRRDVPEQGGIYVIVKSRRLLGLPVVAVPLYVGKSHNLRRRFCRTY